MNTAPLAPSPPSAPPQAPEDTRSPGDVAPLEDVSKAEHDVPSGSVVPTVGTSTKQDISPAMNTSPSSDPGFLRNMPDREKLRLFVLTTLGILLSLLFLLGSISDYLHEDDYTSIDLTIGLGIGLIIGGYTLNYTRRTIGDFRKGLPRVDELTDRIMEKAASSAFFLLLYFNLVRMFFEEDAVGDIIAMLMVYGIFKLWYAHRGESTDMGVA